MVFISIGSAASKTTAGPDALATIRTKLAAVSQDLRADQLRCHGFGNIAGGSDHGALDRSSDADEKRDGSHKGFGSGYYIVCGAGGYPASPPLVPEVLATTTAIATAAADTRADPPKFFSEPKEVCWKL